jgi:microcystin-dependent protein
MATPFLGEVKMISWNFPPKGWAFCNGQLMPINQNQPLFSLLGTTYGGDGRTTFALPDMRGRIPIHVGAGWLQGQVAGELAHTLKTQEMPAHTHSLVADTKIGGANPTNTSRLAGSTIAMYGGQTNLVPMSPSEVTNAGGGQPHENEQPYLVINYVIALQGIFPSRD